MHVRLFVLGVLFEREAHGYEIKALARLWGIEEWANVGYGSLYHALTALAREGLAEEVPGAVEDARRKTTYRITAVGRETFLTLLRRALRSKERAEVDLGLAFAPSLPSDERTALLQERLATLRAQAAQTEGNLERARRELGNAPWIEASVGHHLALLVAEIAWTEGVAERVGSFPVRDWSRVRLG